MVVLKFLQVYLLYLRDRYQVDKVMVREVMSKLYARPFMLRRFLLVILEAVQSSNLWLEFLCFPKSIGQGMFLELCNKDRLIPFMQILVTARISDVFVDVWSSYRPI